MSSSSRTSILCKCGHSPVMRFSTTNKNPGRRFFECRNYGNPGHDCNFFCWVDRDHKSYQSKEVCYSSEGTENFSTLMMTNTQLMKTIEYEREEMFRPLCIRWTDHMDDLALNWMIEHIEEIRPRGYGARRFCNAIAIVINSATRKCINEEHVRSRIIIFRKEYMIVTNVLSTPGFDIRWDGKNQCVAADPAVWNLFVLDHPIRLHVELNRPMPRYERLRSIFGPVIANGANVVAEDDPNLLDFGQDVIIID